MGTDLAALLMGLLAVAAVIVGFILVIIFIVVPLFAVLGKGIGAIGRGIGWFVAHIASFIGGMLKDTVRLIGALLAMVLLAPFVPLNIIIGRWSAAGHYAAAVKRECRIGTACLYRAALQRPLKLVLLDGLLEGLEQRVPEAVQHAPAADRPARRAGQFPGYTIVGSLRSGGSGAKLYIAEPDAGRRRLHPAMGERVVIKSFELSEGSPLPQIIRESRALESARQLGLVFDHGMDDHRFFYIMPYHPGDHLGVITRQLHGESEGDGLARPQLQKVLGYARNLLEAVSRYHHGGLWHKDIKPENIIVHDGTAHVVDLGLVTPLRSAMTLTTHGTEYFRDPEMVRQALRGVKVHQVDGAKFDIYAVGAVIYFMLENTFPAHSGLSRFEKSSPEALRWIVRRAMTDYQQRYATADAMLGDLRVVMAAADPFVVKPVDLPSMGSAAPAIMAADAPAAAAGVPSPSEAGLRGYGIAAGIGAAGPFAQVGRFHVDAEGNPLPWPGPARAARPRLRVTNWWTGAYVVDDAAPAAPQPAPARSVVAAPAVSVTGPSAAREFRQEAWQFREETDRLREAVRSGTMTARRAARLQIRAARDRAAALRRRAGQRRAHYSHDRQPSWAAAIITLIILTLGAGFIYKKVSEDGGQSEHLVYAPTSGDGAVEVVQTIASPGAAAVSMPRSRIDSHLPLLLIDDNPWRLDSEVAASVRSAVAAHEAQGWTIASDTDAESAIRGQLPLNGLEPGAPISPLLRKVLAERRLSGLLWIRCQRDEARRTDRIVMTRLAGEGDAWSPPCDEVVIDRSLNVTE